MGLVQYQPLGSRAKRLFWDVIKEPDLLFLVPMNELSGVLYDRCTRYSLTATVSGNPVYAKSLSNGFYGLDFDGTGDWASFGDVAALEFERTSPFTLLAVVNTASAGAAMTLLSKYDGTKGWIWRFDSSIRPEFVLRNTITTNEIRVHSDVACVNDVPSIISVTYSGSEAASGVLHYIDGVVRADTDDVNNLTGTTVSDGLLQIGAANSATPMLGDVAFVAAFGAVKSAEVQRRWAFLSGML